jgi:hypothetical protein
LALMCGISEADAFVQHFIDYESGGRCYD